MAAPAACGELACSRAFLCMCVTEWLRDRAEGRRGRVLAVPAIMLSLAAHQCVNHVNVNVQNMPVKLVSF